MALNLSTIRRLATKKPPVCTAVIAAAGLSQRCKGEDKLFYPVGGKPVIAYTIEAFQKCALINEIIIVARREQFDSIADICKQYNFDKVSKIIKGATTRAESVMGGVFAVSRKTKLIAIHDGARPCIDTLTIENVINAAAKYHAAAPATRIISTVKRVDNSMISETVSREGLFEIQTPQIFRAEIIKAALINAAKKNIDVTDDCMAAELIGVRAYIVEGSRTNIKITENEDLQIAESILRGRIL